MKKLLLIPLLALTLAACRSSHELPTAETAPAADGTAASATSLVRKVTANRQTAQTITARIKMDLNAGGSSLSANGTLRMKRDDVVQLSLTFLGMEVGRMEFTPDGVLIIDRMNKQYVRATYSDVGFLRQAGLDFYTLQALFWDELFVPGQRDAASAAGRFALSSADGYALLTLSDAPGLNYTFRTGKENGCIEAVYVAGRDGQPGNFSWTYAGFTDFGGKPFPTQMACAVNGTGKDVGFTLKLSRLGNDADWNTRSQVPGKYTQRDADEILRRLAGH